MRKYIAASLLCVNPLQLQKDMNRLQEVGADLLHIDILDGTYAPETWLNTKLALEIAANAPIPVDIHVMAMDPDSVLEPFLSSEALCKNIHGICFHPEVSRHPLRLIHCIKDKGIPAGIALAPHIPFRDMEYILPECDYVLMMLINPGYAYDAKESVTEASINRVAACRAYLQEHNKNIPIEVDGRITPERIQMLSEKGADIFVVGSSLWKKERTMKENFALFAEQVSMDINSK